MYYLHVIYNGKDYLPMQSTPFYFQALYFKYLTHYNIVSTKMLGRVSVLQLQVSSTQPQFAVLM